MKAFKNLIAVSLLTWSTSGFCQNLSVFEGTYSYTGSNYDPTSATCPGTLVVKQVLTAKNELVKLQFIGVGADGKAQLIQNVDHEDIYLTDSFYKNPKQSLVNIGGPGQVFAATMVINDDGNPSHRKYVYINIKKFISFDQHLNCGYTL